MREWATNSEETHVHTMGISKTDKFPYFRLNVIKGIGTMKMDEWKTRGKIRRGAGVLVGKFRKASPTSEDALIQRTVSIGETAVERNVNRSNSSHGEGLLNIPKFFRARNTTIEYITEQTNDYLRDAKVQKWLNECASYLVNCRRRRVQTDRERWESALWGQWYQCTQDHCLRGEKEYESREKLRRHFRDKHGHMFTDDPAGEIRLETELDESKVIVQ